MRRSIPEEMFLERVRSLAAGKVIGAMMELVLELDVFTKLQGRSWPLAEFGARLELPPLSARLLAQFLCREGLLVYADGALSNSPVVDAFLTSETPDRKNIHKLTKLAIPLEALKQRLFHPPVLHWYQLRDQGEITDGSSMVGQVQEDWLCSFLASNHAARLQWGEELADRYDFSRHQTLLDIGGASGGWCIGIRKANPHLRCLVFDLPPARELAEKSAAEAGEQDHVSFVAGSFFVDDLPRGADVALLANIIHGWAPADDLIILRKAYDALQPGGTLLVKEYFLADDWTGPMEAVFSAFVVLGQEGRGGWQPSYGEMTQLLEETGFREIERRHDLVISRKPLN